MKGSRHTAHMSPFNASHVHSETTEKTNLLTVNEETTITAIIAQTTHLSAISGNHPTGNNDNKADTETATTKISPIAKGTTIATARLTIGMTEEDAHTINKEKEEETIATKIKEVDMATSNDLRTETIVSRAADTTTASKTGAIANKTAITALTGTITDRPTVNARKDHFVRAPKTITQMQNTVFKNS